MKKYTTRDGQDLSIIITKEALQVRIAELAAQIEQDFTGNTLTIVCTLRGAVLFFADLAKSFTVPLKMDFIEVSSYGDQETSSGIIKIHKDLTNSIKGQDVLLVEDIIDTGGTVAQLMNHLYRQKPNSLKVCALLDKPSRRVVDISADYVGFEVEDVFVVGYGLDYNQKYRNLPFVGRIG